jgi:bacteriorhodopsin
MSHTTEIWLWIAFVGMVLGSLVFGLQAVAQRRKEGMEFALVSFFICLWAASMYLTMIFGETVLVNFNGQKLVLWGRYLDWIVTTPLLLLDLGVIAGLRPKLIAGVIAADVFMIVTGVVATLENSPHKYVWYIISCGTFLAIYGMLMTEFTSSANLRGNKVNRLFVKLRNTLIALWTVYPIVWLLGPEGLNFIGTETETAIYAIIDLGAKVGFGAILTFTNREVLAQASNKELIMATVDDYMGKPHPLH